MAGRPRKRLIDYVLGGTFRAREDGDLLGVSDDLPWPGFALLRAERQDLLLLRQLPTILVADRIRRPETVTKPTACCGTRSKSSSLAG